MYRNLRTLILISMMAVFARADMSFNNSTGVSGGAVQVKTADSPSIDAFSRLRVSNPVTLFESKQIHDNAPLFWDDQEVSGSGTTSVHSPLTASTVMAVSASTAGKRVRQTFMRPNYQPGKSQLVFMTGTLGNGGGGVGIKRAMGVFDDDNGIFALDDEGTMNLVIRSSTSGAPVDTAFAQGNWSEDNLDGSGPSGVDLDGAKSQIFAVDYEWLGVGRVRLGFVVNGIIIYCHEFNHANLTQGVYMSTPNLPLRYEIENLGTGGVADLEHICSTVISEGGSISLGVNRSASTDGIHVDANVEGTVYAVLGIRLKAGHTGDTIETIGMSMSEHAGNKNYEWMCLMNPTVAGTFTYVDETDSAIQVARGATANTVTGGTRTANGFGSSSSKGSATPGDLDSSLLLGSSIAGVSDTVVLCVRPIGGSTNIDIDGSMTWKRAA